MANKPFDQRVINHLERPTSGDLNTAQSQINIGGRALMRQLLQPNPLVVGTGSLGESFFVEKLAGEDRKFKIKRGVGFNYAAYNASTDLNIDGITGLSDPFDYRMVTLQSEEGVELTVEPGPGVGLCRRDLIAIRCTNPSTNQLEDYADTDIYDPTLNKFNAVSKPKTFSYDLTGSVPQVLDYTQIGSATDAVVYIKGQVIPYAGPDSLLDAPVTIVPNYLNIAIINVVESVSTVEQSDVVDFRRLVAPQGNLTIRGSATIGSSGLAPGTLLSNVSLKTPPGIKAQLVKSGSGDANSYLLLVYGPRVVSSAAIAYSCGTDAAAYAEISAGISGWALNPTQIVQGPIAVNQGVTEEVQTLAASSSASPTQQVAIGQPYHVFPFTLCRVDNITVTETSPVSGSIAIAPLIIPDSAPNAWPAGVYSTIVTPSTQTYYLQYPSSAASPTTGIPSPVYALKTDASLNTENAFTSGNNGNIYTRVIGYVTDAADDWQNFPAGVWKFSARIRVESPVTNPIVYLKAAIYSYDGSTNPELSPSLGQVSDVLITANYLTPNLCDERIDFYVHVPATTVAAGERLYLALSTRWAYGTGGSSDVVTIYHNGDAPFVLESPVPVNTVVTTTIPNLADRYPSDTYPLSGSFTADPISVNAAGEDQVLNPSATRFGRKFGQPNIRAVPITFTLNLTVE